MIPNDPLLRKDMIERMLGSINMDDLTKWEDDFINSIKEQFIKKQTLSDRQCEILERIYDQLLGR